MRILVTGGTGYMGTHIVSALAVSERVDEILLLDNLQAARSQVFFLNSLRGKKVTFIEADILDSRTLHKALAGVDLLIHAAGLVPSSETTDTHVLEQINHWGTSVVCQAIESNRTPHVIFISDTQVLGTSDTILDESAEPNPQSPYAFSKFRAESHILSLPAFTKKHVLRLPEVVGSQVEWIAPGLVNQWIFDSHFKRRIQIFGNGRNMVSLTSVHYFMQIISEIIQETIPPGIYTVSEYNVQLLDVVEVLKEIDDRLEFIFINPHVNIKNTAVALPVKLHKYVHPSNVGLKETIWHAKKMFSF